MEFIVEDGSIVENANSYVSVQYADDYFAIRNIDVWSAFTDEQKKARLIVATQYIDLKYGVRFKGDIVSNVQPLSFPRTPWFVKESENSPEKYFLPKNLIQACCEYALVVDGESMSLVSNITSSATGGEIKRKKENVGAIETETEYFSSSSSSYSVYPVYTIADGLMEYLCVNPISMFCIRN